MSWSLHAGYVCRGDEGVSDAAEKSMEERKDSSSLFPLPSGLSQAPVTFLEKGGNTSKAQKEKSLYDNDHYIISYCLLNNLQKINANFIMVVVYKNHLKD